MKCNIQFSRHFSHMFSVIMHFLCSKNYVTYCSYNFQVFEILKPLYKKIQYLHECSYCHILFNLAWISNIWLPRNSKINNTCKELLLIEFRYTICKKGFNIIFASLLLLLLLYIFCAH